MRFSLPLLLLACALAGCSGAAKKAAHQAEQERIVANSRVVEQRRMRLIETGEVNSERGAEIAVADPDKTFDPQKTPGFGARSFHATGSRVKEFRYAQKAEGTGFRTKDFAGSKSSRLTESTYSTESARTKDYAGPNAARAVATETSPTKDAREAGKTMSTRGLPGGDRAYLGPEAERVKRAIEPGSEPRVTQDLRELRTIEDVRELLNKNK